MQINEITRIPISKFPCLDLNETYVKISNIGKGTFGEVYKAHKKGDPNKLFALKKIITDKEKEGFPITALREIMILQKFRHINIVSLIEIVTSKEQQPQTKKMISSTYVVLEYMQHDLSGIIMRNISFRPEHVKCMMKQLAEGIHFLHSRGIIHRDIKTSNILMNNQGELKLADFGLARQTRQSNIYTGNVVTLWYRPPEILYGSHRYTTKIDMWSLGCIFAEILLGKPIFAARNEEDIIAKIYEKCGTPSVEAWPELTTYPLYQKFEPKRKLPRKLAGDIRAQIPNIGDDAIELLDRLLTLNPDYRISAEEVLNHPYFKTDPLPCQPSELPRIEAECHDMIVRESKQKKRENPNINDNIQPLIANKQVENVNNNYSRQRHFEQKDKKIEPNQHNQKKKIERKDDLDQQASLKNNLQMLLAKRKKDSSIQLNDDKQPQQSQLNTKNTKPQKNINQIDNANNSNNNNNSNLINKRKNTRELDLENSSNKIIKKNDKFQQVVQEQY